MASGCCATNDSSTRAPLTLEEQSDLASVPVVSGENGPRPKLANTGKLVPSLRAIDPPKYGVSSCGPPGFYGNIGASLLCSHGSRARYSVLPRYRDLDSLFSTIPSVIPAFAKRGDIIVADRGISFTVQKGLQMSRSTVRWFDHNDLRSLEDVLLSVETERRIRCGPLKRRFVVTEGIFEKDGAMVDLPKPVNHA
ncbi:hypothetical protein EDB83DRAFT_2554665 [Lactarius deliciosus]|nr:hypothetical protein EDB83DRAFT_2322793 [Lactarius deliciosus]KAH9034383.1 hypothetical protein EDB83DRAFT_2554665 [Lactarius deliciosus]